ncbi:MAG: Radical SAM domain protein [Synergistales bacterium 58_81]|nr:MAG: Radical SAM domain protein [Synergistales bacterium 58_81]HCR38156.1 TIGR01212 family radical SAM protein [Synergistaceae bacterium]
MQDRHPPYNSWSRWLRRRWGTEVRKIPLDTGMGCPNRDSDLLGGCIFCDARGGGSGAFLRSEDLETQIRSGFERIQRKGRDVMALLYFQSYSSTNTASNFFQELLERTLSLASGLGKVAGVAVGARPDQVPDEILDMLERISRERSIDVWIELGVQTMDPSGLDWLERGHGTSEVIDVLARSSRRRIFTCAHLISGIPGEKKGQLAASSLQLSDLGVDALKFHPLYVLTGTRLEALFRSGTFIPPEVEEYVHDVIEAIRYIPDRVILQRISADASPPELVSPSWISQKSMVLSLVQEGLKSLGARQGDLYPFR